MVGNSWEFRGRHTQFQDCRGELCMLSPELRPELRNCAELLLSPELPGTGARNWRPELAVELVELSRVPPRLWPSIVV